MQNYAILSKKGEGTFSEVMVGVCVRTHARTAIKCMKKKFESLEDVYKLPEIQALRRLAGHPNIIRLHDVLFEGRRLALVMELMDMNLYEAIKDRQSFIPENRIVSWVHQLFQALAFMHENQLFHRDVKPENLLLRGDCLKLGDLGSCSRIDVEGPPFTEYISTRWYRAPECLLTSGFYGFKMDIWAAGCVLYEVATLHPLFPGKNELDQIHKIHAILGTPSDRILGEFRSLPGEHLGHISFQPMRGSGFGRKLQHCSSQLVSLLSSTLTYDPTNRPTAFDCLRCGLFSRLGPPVRLTKIGNRLSDPQAWHPSSDNTFETPPASFTPVVSPPDVPPFPNSRIVPALHLSNNAGLNKRGSRSVAPKPQRSEGKSGFLTHRIRSKIPQPHVTTRKPNQARYRNFSRIYRIDLQSDERAPQTHR